MIDDVETLCPVGVVDAANVAEQREAAARVIAQELQDARQRLPLNVNTQLAIANLGRADRAGQSGSMSSIIS